MMDWLLDANFQWVLAGCVMLGLSSGILSSFAMLRKRSLMGDALAHAALPGICLAFMIVGERSLFAFMIGALVAGMLGAACIQTITRHSRIKEDTALGLVLSVFFAVGIVLLTQILHSGGGTKAGLDKFLFGQAAAMIGSDVQVMTGCAALICLLAMALYKELKLLCFDPGYADSIGFSSNMLDFLLNLLIVMIVVVGLQAVGVVLMVALLITPAASARFWTDRLNRMVVFSALIGAGSGALGTYLSTVAQRLPTGPLIVLSATIWFAISLFFAPNRGLIAKMIRYLKLRKKIARENILRTLYELAESAGSDKQAFPLSQIAARRNQSPRQAAWTLTALEDEGWVVELNTQYSLTNEGLKKAYAIVRNHRLWEMFLMHEEQIGADHVDRDADYIEHFLPKESVQELERLLLAHGRDPKLPPSVHPIEHVGA